MNQRIQGAAEPSPETASGARAATRWWIISALLLLVAIVLIGFWSTQASGGALASPAIASATAEDGRPDSPPSGVEPTPVAAEVAPATVHIPAIDLQESLISLGLNPDGTVEVPTDYSRAGLYEHGPAPGEPGSAVILGHVDSHTGPAVFHRLHELQANDVVDVGLADGGIAHYVVTSVETHPKAEFPAERVYGPNGGASLQLVTCGGVFDSAARSYVSNVVAYTSLAGVTPP